MSRQLPDHPNLQYLKKEAKELLRGMQQGKLADAQHTLANEYGFVTWAKLKLHVQAQGLSPAEALKVAVCDSDAARVREVLQKYPELRARIDDPLPDYGFGQHALFAAVQRSDRATIDVLLHAGANVRKRTEWWAGGFGVLDECDPSMVDFLIERGAVVDVHSASRLGMMAKLLELVASDPNAVYALKFGHEDVFQLLMERTPEDLRLALACELGDETVFREFLSKNPDTAKTLSQTDQRKLPDAAQSNNTQAVRLMLEAGWPVDAPGEMGATALHWAGFNGNAEMTREILRFHPALELKSREYEGTALGWAVFGSGNSWRRDIGDYVGTVQVLLEAGAIPPPHAEELEPSDAVLEVLP